MENEYPRSLFDGIAAADSDACNSVPLYCYHDHGPGVISTVERRDGPSGWFGPGARAWHDPSIAFVQRCRCHSIGPSTDRRLVIGMRTRYPV